MAIILGFSCKYSLTLIILLDLQYYYDDKMTSALKENFFVYSDALLRLDATITSPRRTFHLMLLA